MLNGVHVLHTQGDSADEGILNVILARYQFEAAIVMGTLVGADLPPQSRDRRVLTTMLLLRTIHAKYHGDRHLHVVGENSLESTSVLALAPESSHLVPDFVNTQAINARVLIQALAYPYMQTAIAQLFHANTGAPQLVLSPVGQIVPAGPATFAQVTQTILARNSQDVCLGYLALDGLLYFAPHPDEVHQYDEGDQIMLFTRGNDGRKEVTVGVADPDRPDDSDGPDGPGLPGTVK
jgi:hypothetical protein